MSRAVLILSNDAVREKPCAQCGTVFAKDPRISRKYWARQKYCSQGCAGLANSAARCLSRRPLAESFVQNFVESGGCWEWQAARDKDGYGIFSLNRKSYRAPRVALYLDGRPVPKNRYACHHCDNPACVRPSHLYVGTPTQNMADASDRGRLRSGESSHFAKLTVKEVREIRAMSGTQSEIALSFGVARGTISLIQSRKTWRNVA